MLSISHRIATELGVQAHQINAAITLLDQGDTVPFISRYRKEVTGGLDDTQMRSIEDRVRYLRELQDRRKSILASIEEQGKLTETLANAINNTESKSELEDLYLPYKKKRRTRGQIAIEAGLEPLANQLLADPSLEPEAVAQSYINIDNGIADTKAALDGAKFILMERFAEQAALIKPIREFMKENAHLRAKLMAGKETEGQKFSDYFDHHERLTSTPSHRALAMFRGRNEGILTLDLVLPEMLEASILERHPAESMIADFANIRDGGRPADKWLLEVVRWTWRIKLYPHIETDLLGILRENAEDSAIKVFADNLKDLLLAAPAGPKVTIGLDPGLRTGVKVAIVDNTGKVLDHGAIFPTPPQNKIREAAASLTQWIKRYNVDLIAIGNGTASRETERFVKEVIKSIPNCNTTPVVVNEAGASVYSASETASKEFPNLDVTIRGAISIARRLQDPLAELVKIEPKSIGVGQYQHDVSQVQLARNLDAVVEDCVNSVGVDLNTASAPLLAQVAGLNNTIATNIIHQRDVEGRFENRKQLLKVSRLGPKAFEQSGGFLRIQGGNNPLDASGVHPEAYGVVEKMAADLDVSIEALMRDPKHVQKLNADRYVTEQFGRPTINDILKELTKPGRDPRPEFKTAKLQDGVESIKDLIVGMLLEGTVTNVTNFGAFVDIGVHQDGLVHISALSNTFVSDPREVVKAGQIVKVKVMEVDAARKRIALSMRLNDTPAAKTDNSSNSRPHHNRTAQKSKQGSQPQANGAMAAALSAAFKK